MFIKSRKAYASLFIICFIISPIFLIFQNSMIVLGLDKALDDADVPEAWDFPDNDATYDNTLGTGIKVAIVDTGIDWQHPDFYRPDFSVQYDILWNGTAYFIDFDPDGAYNPGEGAVLNITELYKNKTLYTGAGIDPGIDCGYFDGNLNGKYDYGAGEKISYYLDVNSDGKIDTNDKAVPLDRCKIDLIRDYSTGKNYFNGINLTIPAINDEADYDGHGTHIAGIIAAGWPGIRNITGVAPNSTLLIYKVASWNNDNVSQGIYDAVNDGADVISLSYAEFFKNKTLDGSGIKEGGSIVEDAIDWAWGQGIPVVVAVGNFANKWVHNLISVPITNASAPFDIPATASWNGIDYDGCYEIEFLNVWSDPNEKIGLNVTLPDPLGVGQWTIPDDIYGGPSWNGNPLPSGPFMVQRERYDANINGLNKSYMKVWRADLAPIWFPPAPPAVGIYDIFNYGTNTQDVHVYLNSRYGDSPSKWFSGLPGVNWMPVVTPFYTIASPATANNCITVGSYITTFDPSLSANQLGDISDFSSQGPRVDEVEQLDVIAPGEVILSTASRNATSPYNFGPGNFTTKRGTSMAAPFVAGVIALAMGSINLLKGNPALVEDLLINSTYEDSFTTIYGTGYNNVTGYGKVNASKFLKLAHSLIVTDTIPPNITFIQPALNNTVISQPTLSIIANITDANLPISGNVIVEISNLTTFLFNVSMSKTGINQWTFSWNNITSYRNFETYIIRIWAKDSSPNGNYNWSSRLYVYVNIDTTPPDIIFIQPPSNNTIITREPYTIIVNITDDNLPISGNVIVEISNLTAFLFNASMSQTVTNQWTFSWDNITSYANFENYIIRVWAKDSSPDENYKWSVPFYVYARVSGAPPPGALNFILYILFVILIFAAILYYFNKKRAYILSKKKE